MESQPTHADKIRAGLAKWRNAPPGLTPDLADQFMARLKADTTTIRKMTGLCTRHDHFCSFGRFKKHCELNPGWAAEAWRISTINANLNKGAKKRAMTHCFRGHSLAGAPVRRDKKGYLHRECVECDRIYQGSIIKPDALIAVTAALTDGATINQVIRGAPKGGGPRNSRLQLTNVKSFYRYRRENPAFDSFVLTCIQNRVWTPMMVEPNSHHYVWDPDDDRVIRAMLPGGFQGRDDVVQSIFLALFEGRLDRRDLEKRLRRFIAMYDKEHPTKYARFGDGLLVSLDEVLFEKGATTRSDMVSCGLWD